MSDTEVPKGNRMESIRDLSDDLSNFDSDDTVFLSNLGASINLIGFECCTTPLDFHQL
jgi:hypothetical protein